MYTFQRNFSIKNLNSFGINCNTNYYVTTSSLDEIKSVLENSITKQNDILILGSGSNMLFTRNFDGLIIQPINSDIKIVSDNSDNCIVEVGAGCEFDEFIQWCVNNKLYGAENLSNIPGNIGSSAVQNIGAYGAEAKDIIFSVSGVYINNSKEFTLSNDECKFGYRNSIFKNKLKDNTIINSVTFKLSKHPKLNLEYGDIKAEISKIGDVNLVNLRKAIINIRSSKLPNYKETGNAGSFFKNPVISYSQFNDFIKKYPTAPHYKINTNEVKIPAGWLIDQAGWKGKIVGNAGVHDKQALVLVNKTGKATGNEILKLSDLIIEDINNKFGISLEPEVVIY